MSDAARGEPCETTQDPERLRDDIERTREELGSTVEALAAKADVKAQAKQRAEEGKQALRDQTKRAQEKVSELPSPVRIAAGVVGLLLVLFLLKRR